MGCAHVTLCSSILDVWLCLTVVVNDKYLGSKEKKKICLTWSYAPTVKKWSLYIQIKEKCKHQLIYSCRQFQNPLSCVFCVQGPKAKKAWPNILLSLKHCVIREVLLDAKYRLIQLKEESKHQFIQACHQCTTISSKEHIVQLIEFLTKKNSYEILHCLPKCSSIAIGS